MQIVLHSYTFRDYSLEETCRAAASCGYEGIELQRAHFDEDRLEEELPRCINLASEFGLPIACVDYTADFIQEDLGLVEASVTRLERSIEICAANGVTLMNGFTGFLTGDDPANFGANGSALANDKHYEQAAEALRRVAKTAEAHDVIVTLEIHMNTIHDTVAAAARLLDLAPSPNLLANPDPGNLFGASTAEKSPDALDALAGRIGYFHFKNAVNRDGTADYNVSLEDGEIDSMAWLRKLDALGYNGPVCIEYVGEGDPHPIAERDIAFLCACMDSRS